MASALDSSIVASIIAAKPQFPPGERQDTTEMPLSPVENSKEHEW